MDEDQPPMQPPPVQGVAPRTEMQILGSQMFHAIENLGRNSQNQLRQLQDQNHAFVEQLQKAAQDAPLSFTEKDPKFPTWDGNRGSLLVASSGTNQRGEKID